MSSRRGCDRRTLAPLGPTCAGRSSLRGRALGLFKRRAAARPGERRPAFNGKCLTAGPCDWGAVVHKTAFSHWQQRCVGGQRGPLHGCGQDVWRALLLRPASATPGAPGAALGPGQGGRAKGSLPAGGLRREAFPSGTGGASGFWRRLRELGGPRALSLRLQAPLCPSLAQLGATQGHLPLGQVPALSI